MSTIAQKRCRIIELVPQLTPKAREGVFNLLEGIPHCYSGNSYLFDLSGISETLLETIYCYVTLQYGSKDESTIIEDVVEEYDDNSPGDEDDIEYTIEEKTSSQSKVRKQAEAMDDADYDYDELFGKRKKKGKFEFWLERSRAKAKANKKSAS